MVEESVPLSPTVGDLRYNAAVHDDGRIELRGYSLSGAPFEMGRLLVGLREAFGPSIEIARGEDEPPEEDDSSEFSSSVRFLFSGLVLEGEGPGEVVSSGFVTVSIQRDLVQAFYDRTNTNAPAEPVIGRLAAATAKSVV